MRASLFVAVLALTGCDQLFPEFSAVSTGAQSDLAVAASDGGVNVLSGKVCLLSDLRSPSSCTSAVPGRTITVIETGATATSDSTGAFVISTTNAATVTLSVTSPANSAQTSVPTVSVLTGSVLASAIKNGMLLPVIDADTFSNIELDNGVGGDDARGAIVAWVLSPSGVAVSGAVATRMSTATGPLYDSNAGDMLETGAATSTFGTVSFLDVLPGTTALTIGAPASSGLSGDTFNLTVRPGSVTVAALALPPATTL
jgi:hypothetical protein